MNDYESARSIALNLLSVSDTLDESKVRVAAENAVRAITSQEPGHIVDLEALVRELEANLNVVVGYGATLVDNTRDHVPWLAERRSEIEWGFSRRYGRFLKESKGWATQTLQRTNEQTDQIIGLLEDPARTGDWDRRGMVVGQVQSGKTSNYIALICKAADAGYKFIVILTGTTNSLRAQTQLRIDEGFLGWDTRLNLALSVNNRRVGVGALVGEQMLRVIPSTNAEETGKLSIDDLSPRIREQRTREDELSKLRLGVEAEMLVQGPNHVDVVTIKTHANDLKSILQEADLVSSKAFLKTFIKRIEINCNEVTVQYTLPRPLHSQTTDKISVLPIDTPGGGYYTIRRTKIFKPAFSL